MEAEEFVKFEESKEKLRNLIPMVHQFIIELISKGYRPLELSTCFFSAYIRILAMSMTPEENISQALKSLGEDENILNVINEVRRVRIALKEKD